MNWDIYSSKFDKQAIKFGLSKAQITACLEYAFNLHSKNVPIIYEQRHLSLLVGYKESYLRRVSNDPRKFYRTFSIPKKSGGKRIISEPLPSLKEIQQWVLREILYTQRFNPFAKAFIPNRSIRQNARFHVGQKIVLTIDITNFFGSIPYRDILNLFRHLGYSVSVSTILSKLCCLNGVLPQGAPTSPALSNLILNDFDKRISSFSISKQIRYTRYADDMTFSGDFDPGMVIKFVRNVLSDHNLRINSRKIQLRRPHQRQEVTGVVVNVKLQAPRALRRKLRQSVYYIEKFGFSSHLDWTKNSRANHIQHLIGVANFIIFINPEDKEALNLKNILITYLPNLE